MDQGETVMVAIVGGLVVFLVGCCLVALVAIYRRLPDIGERIAAHLTGLDGAAAQRAEEDRKHRDATSEIVVGAMREVGGAVVKELRRQAHQRHTMVQELVGSAYRGSASGEDWPLALVEPPECADLPASQPRAVVKPGTCTLPPDAPTPPSGYPVGALLADADGETR